MITGSTTSIELYFTLALETTVVLTGVWDRYAMVFEDIWAASAFKGATGPCAFVTDIGFHVDNHCIWFRYIRNNQSKFKSFKGLALTGWQRY